MNRISKALLVIAAGLVIGVISRLLYLNWYVWRLLLNSASQMNYGIGGLISGLLVWFDPGLSWILAGMATGYECGEGLLGDSPLHELAWYLPYYVASLALSLLVKKTITAHWHPAPRSL